MADPLVIKAMDGPLEGMIRVRLTCGHYSTPVGEASSWFDFTHEPDTCPTCSEERQMDLTLQVLIGIQRRESD